MRKPTFLASELNGQKPRKQRLKKPLRKAGEKRRMVNRLREQCSRAERHLIGIQQALRKIEEELSKEN